MKNFIDLVEDFIRAHFDKLFLTCILVLLIYVGANSSIEKVKDWAMGEANTVIGAIIMLVTGKVVQRVTDGNSEERHVEIDTIKKEEKK